MHFPLKLSRDSMVWQVHRLLSHGWDHMLNEVTIPQVFIVQVEDLLIIIDQIDEMALLILHKFSFLPNVQLER